MKITLHTLQELRKLGATSVHADPKGEMTAVEFGPMPDTPVTKDLGPRQREMLQEFDDAKKADDAEEAANAARRMELAGTDEGLN